jgi:hypothetical protein
MYAKIALWDRPQIVSKQPSLAHKPGAIFTAFYFLLNLWIFQQASVLDYTRPEKYTWPPPLCGLFCKKVDDKAADLN